MTKRMGILAQIRQRLMGAPALAIALSLAMAQTNAAFAAIDNTVTVTATQPGGGAYLPEPTATESVDVADDTPTLDVVKAHTLTKGPGNTNLAAEAGDTINYTYTIENTGNVTVTNVSVIDQHDFPLATSALPGVAEPATYTDNQPDGPNAGQTGDSSDAASDGSWDELGPGDVVVFTGSHVVTPADLNANGGGVTSDGDIDNTATVSGDYNDGVTTVTVSDSSSDSVPLYLNPLLTITKVANDDTEVTAGQVITYTYTVSNGGNVDMTAITLSDTHKGVLNALTPGFVSFSPGGLGSTNTGNTIDVLKPGDSAVFTTTYTVTQDDIDNLQ